MPSTKKKTKTKKKTTTNKGVKKSTKKVTAKSPTKNKTKINIKESVAKTTLPKKTVKKASRKTGKSQTTGTTKRAVVSVSKNIPKKAKKELENTIVLPKTKEQVKIEEETRQLELKQELERKLKEEENLEKTHELKLQKINKSKSKTKSHAKNIAKNKTSEFRKQIKKFQRKIKIYGIKSIVSKKYFMIGIIIAIFVSLCIVSINMVKPEIESINLDNISKEIDQLKTLHFEINNTSKIIEESKAYKDTLKEYYEYDFNDFNLKRSWLDEFKIYYNEKNRQLFMAFKPSSDNSENVSEAIEKFLKAKKINATKEEYDDYLFYIASNDDKKVISKVKQCQIKVFDILQELNKEEIKEKYGIDSSLYKEYKVKTAMIIKSDVTEYLLFYPKNKNCAKEITELMDKYYQKKEETWQNDEENLKIIQNRYTGNYDGYLIYIVSKDNDLVLQLLKK